MYGCDRIDKDSGNGFSVGAIQIMSNSGVRQRKFQVRSVPSPVTLYRSTEAEQGKLVKGVGNPYCTVSVVVKMLPAQVHECQEVLPVSSCVFCLFSVLSNTTYDVLDVISFV